MTLSREARDLYSGLRDSDVLCRPIHYPRKSRRLMKALAVPFDDASVIA